MNDLSLKRRLTQNRISHFFTLSDIYSHATANLQIAVMVTCASTWLAEQLRTWWEKAALIWWPVSMWSSCRRDLNQPSLVTSHSFSLLMGVLPCRAWLPAGAKYQPGGTAEVGPAELSWRLTSQSTVVPVVEKRNRRRREMNPNLSSPST